ncbi:TIGR02391 family protein [Halobacteroides halobius]|uniref:TIGR02391 family protein n=1 Tax=Halobacteroides halobius TaxID=42422 RepID=UPI0012EA3967|nr:TIGR02391 family protein [Halobacteroides halobius]
MVPELLFHQSITEEAWPSMKIGKYDNAVFEAFKLVEIRVREIGNFPQDKIGVALIREAFNVDSGPLQNFDLPKAEQEAISHFFSGAIGLYKNPHSHRKVELEFKEAFEMVLIASHLLSKLDSIEERISEKIYNMLRL